MDEVKANDLKESEGIEDLKRSRDLQDLVESTASTEECDNESTSVIIDKDMDVEGLKSIVPSISYLSNSSCSSTNDTSDNEELVIDESHGDEESSNEGKIFESGLKLTVVHDDKAEFEQPQNSPRRSKKILINHQQSGAMYSSPQRNPKRRKQKFQENISEELPIPSTEFRNQVPEAAPAKKKIKTVVGHDDSSDEAVEVIPESAIDPLMIPTILQSDAIDHKLEKCGTTLKKIKTSSLTQNITKITPDPLRLTPLPTKARTDIPPNLIDFFSKRQDKTMKIVKVNPRSSSVSSSLMLVRGPGSKAEKDSEDAQALKPTTTDREIGSSPFETDDLSKSQPIKPSNPLALTASAQSAKILNQPTTSKVFNRVSLQKKSDGSYRIIQNSKDEKGPEIEKEPEIKKKFPRQAKKNDLSKLTTMRDAVPGPSRCIPMTSGLDTLEPPPLVILRPPKNPFKKPQTPSTEVRTKPNKPKEATVENTQSQSAEDGYPPIPSLSFFDQQSKVLTSRGNIAESSAGPTKVQLNSTAESSAGPTKVQLKKSQETSLQELIDKNFSVQYLIRKQSPEIVKYTIPQGMLFSTNEIIRHDVNEPIASVTHSSEIESSEMFVDEPEPEKGARFPVAVSSTSRRKSVLEPKNDDDEIYFDDGQFLMPKRPQANIDLIENLATYRVYMKTVLKKLGIQQIDLNEDGDEYINLYKIFRS